MKGFFVGRRGEENSFLTKATKDTKHSLTMSRITEKVIFRMQKWPKLDVGPGWERKCFHLQSIHMCVHTHTHTHTHTPVLNNKQQSQLLREGQVYRKKSNLNHRHTWKKGEGEAELLRKIVCQPAFTFKSLLLT